ncbi:MAG: hypothetical protein ACREQV_09810, partial [Candidatus Binatia bacterium]
SLISCTSADSEKRDFHWNGKIGADGLISNPSMPLITGDSGIIVSEDFQISLPETGVVQSPPTPVSLAYGRNELLVLDEANSTVLRFDASSGGFLGRSGRQGKGPGELAGPIKIFPTSAGFAVWDTKKSTVEFFDSSARWVRSVVAGGLRSHLRVLSTEEVVTWSIGGSEESPFVIDSGSAGSTRAFFHPQQTGEADPEEKHCFFVGGTSRLTILGRCEVPTLTFYSGDGSRVARWRVQAVPRKTSSADMDRVRKAFASQMHQAGLPDSVVASASRSVAAQYEIQRPFSSVIVGLTPALLLLLEQQPPELNPDSATLHIFSRGGIYLAPVIMPFAIRGMAASPDHLYLIAENPSTGDRDIRAYRVTLSSGVQAFLSTQGLPALLN